MKSSVQASRGDVPYEDRRAYPRVSVAMPAFLHANGERHSVQIVDLSAGGAKLSCPLSLPSGTKVTLDFAKFGGSPAVVRWQSDGLVGICFDSELDPREVSALAARSTALAARMKSAE